MDLQKQLYLLLNTHYHFLLKFFIVLILLDYFLSKAKILIFILSLMLVLEPISFKYKLVHSIPLPSSRDLLIMVTHVQMDFILINQLNAVNIVLSFV